MANGNYTSGNYVSIEALTSVEASIRSICHILFRHVFRQADLLTSFAGATGNLILGDSPDRIDSSPDAWGCNTCDAGSGDISRPGTSHAASVPVLHNVPKTVIFLLEE